ncbi:hypothetical protein C6H88_00790 [Chlamydia muridarum str. Nigg]|uniref:Myosin heavy chain n=2 Tax=Chlamydia muridarum TaxID=83560 RepID=A0A070A120_CHLMR|nr:hypothetical protein [Chlamydia muridarum]AAF39026.1 conserved hypothetical protein [Chlamydia muridarum str. Nigg]AHH22541.1 hypothetical protein TAC_00795 [Chlamydia muridarum str. Nigg3 CMUT3-5]AHH23465.1 hypothetical protein Y015_00795 [Chlamydia muridarum str. Nigg CM972]AID37692.1 hypothetical protein BB17_00815 [Chlamydia muridarum str. Nigg 2 MCR]AIT90377.1 myosin heavy chain [Chlamydia muridarum]
MDIPAQGSDTPEVEQAVCCNQDTVENDHAKEEQPSSEVSTEVVHVQKCESMEAFEQMVAERSLVEEKISFALEQMGVLLKSEDQNNDLKLFWNVRKFCLPLFQQLEDPARRAALWGRYTELTREGRHLKTLQDEEGAFLVRQIELAISCLESDVNEFFSKTEKNEISKEDQDALDIQSLAAHKDFYLSTHADLRWLGSFSSQIINLRKELMNVSMRMRLKSQFFQKLSVLGNRVFPRRKELTEKVSELFAQDVEVFVDKHFSRSSRESLKKAVFFLRKEIKKLQQCAKHLSISSSIFSATRLRLSQCWDQLRGLEKEIRQEQSRLAATSAENVKEIQGQLDQVEALLQGNEEVHKIRKEIETISKHIRGVSLVHDDVVLLKGRIQTLLGQVREREAVIEKEIKEQQAKAEQARAEAIQALEDEVHAFCELCKEGELPEGAKDRCQDLKEAVRKMSYLPYAKKVALDNQVNAAQRTVLERLEEQMLSCPDTKEKVLNMRQVLEQRVLRRKELKAKLECDKKLLGGSGLDFDRALQYSAMVEEDRRALEELDVAIVDLKKQIQQFV